MTRDLARHAAGSVLCLLWLFGARATPAQAQEPPQAFADFSGGWVGFPDDGLVSEPLIGGTLGWFVSPRVSVGPEVSLLQGSDHRHLFLAGNLTFHLATRDSQRVVPYVVVAGGLFQSHYDHPDGSVTTRDGMLSAGAGLHASVSRRVSLGFEARAGWESHLRVTGSIGVKLGARHVSR